jgi:NACalpha-BTF3-like transcription factor
VEVEPLVPWGAQAATLWESDGLHLSAQGSQALGRGLARLQRVRHFLLRGALHPPGPEPAPEVAPESAAAAAGPAGPQQQAGAGSSLSASAAGAGGLAAELGCGAASASSSAAAAAAAAAAATSSAPSSSLAALNPETVARDVQTVMHHAAVAEEAVARAALERHGGELVRLNESPCSPWTRHGASLKHPFGVW